MEPILSRYIWTNTKRQQLWILLVVGASMIPYYMAFNLPKLIVNGPIQGEGFETPDATQTFGNITLDLPWLGQVELFQGIPLERLPMLLALSMAFLALVIVNGLFKFYINTYKGRLGERLLRRIRFALVDRILRFPPARLKALKPGEISSMVKDEVEPLGGFTADAFVQPALLGGQALTALLFIFIQHFWLGMLTFGVAMVQVLVIPKMRQRLIVLGRERQLTARQLAGRVSDIVTGIDTIRAHDTTNFERADIAHRLSRIFRIRYDIYQWKFLVKFLNNFLAQLTPFLFYSFGGYLTIKGTLDVGQLVAVINAYKELPGPLKELIDWDLTRQDVQVKYEQVVEQFESDVLIDADLQSPTPDPDAAFGHPLSVRNVSLVDDSGSLVLDQVSLKIETGERVAFLGPSGSGGGALAEALGRLVWPTSGNILAGEHDLLHLPESLVGRKISYASGEGHLFDGTLEDNLLYGLKNEPRVPRVYTGRARRLRDWEVMEAGLSGNPVFDLNDSWIDEAAIARHTGEADLLSSVMAVFDCVGLSDDVLDMALHTTLDEAQRQTLAERIVALRAPLAAALREAGLGAMVSQFRPGCYNSGATVGENLLFGQLTGEEDSLRRIVRSRFFRELIFSDGIGEDLFAMGRAIAEITVDLFRDMPPDHVFFQRMTLMRPEEIPDYTALLHRLEGKSFATAADADRIALMRLAFYYNERWFRFGVLDEALMRRIVEVRGKIHAGMPDALKPLIEVYETGRYIRSATLLENLLFGKVDTFQSDAERKVRTVASEVLGRDPALCRDVQTIGLCYGIGPAGRRLQAVQRQKLNLARAMIRPSDYYILNQPLTGLDAAARRKIRVDVVDFLAGRPDRPGIVWVTADEADVDGFDRIVRFENGSVVSDHYSETFSRESARTEGVEASA
ncbi:ABC transporter ATP-binding protein [Oceaniglobus roseus]|uniref:ABC transporter ATP-binding protein n=1 Tax=Oceaniglobus roseus TaxID=1737570 RepID=UPI000C7F69F9|nr:ABC transporter ATP-binding protein [Kandeliimicrobium roseum]